jgi:hypothetical protein
MSSSLVNEDKRLRTVTAIVAGAVLILAAASCGGPTRPSPLPDIIGDFDLAQVDGRAVPQLVTFPGGVQCALTRGNLRLLAGKKWEWDWYCLEQSGAPATQHAAGDWFDQPAPDSVVFPTGAATAPLYWGAGRLRGNLLEIATGYPSSTDPNRVGVPVIFGEHQWTFRRQ